MSLFHFIAISLHILTENTFKKHTVADNTDRVLGHNDKMAKPNLAQQEAAQNETNIEHCV